jgi:hypothetical protein
MANIGSPERIIEVVPVKEPIKQPEPVPARTLVVLLGDDERPVDSWYE